MNPLEETGRSTRNIDPCLLVIFGATGDLTGRKLAPAIYNIGKEGLLPANFACVGFARREKSNEEFRDELKKNISSYSRTQPIDEGFWSTFQEQIYYHQSEFDSDEGYEALAKTLADLDKRYSTRGNRVFYLSVQPKFFPVIVEKLRKFNLIYDVNKEQESWSRVVIEKPFGHDLKSAGELQANIHKNLDESQTYRIDHYLGKETVQNIMVFRFANSIFESLWNYKHIDHVQITVAEDIGIGTRGAFFEEEGLLRDVVQNHMMQILSLIAMEPPVSLKASAIHDEKVKVLQSIRPFTDEDFKTIVRGQYGPGFVNGESAIGYRQEKNVNPDSQIETFLALRLYIDNWRWAGSVPFYLRAGKRMAKKSSEVAIVFKDAPGVLFQQPSKKNEQNALTLRIQPDEGISMKINCKVPGPSSPLLPVKMDFRYGSYFGQSPPEAYERLFLDCITGDNTLFARSDEVDTSWKIFTPLLEYWAKTPIDLPNYASGTWGPLDADEMIGSDNRTWRKL
jgi:glucose-6-phosphate 1-dehydrogenase